jgi:hypothetical protein
VKYPAFVLSPLSLTVTGTDPSATLPTIGAVAVHHVGVHVTFGDWLAPKRTCVSPVVLKPLPAMTTDEPATPERPEASEPATGDG